MHITNTEITPLFSLSYARLVSGLELDKIDNHVSNIFIQWKMMEVENT